MTTFTDVLNAWDEEGAANRIHPTRQRSEEAYWASGEPQAQQVVDLVPEGAQVIDFGAGDGRVSIPMHRAGLKVLAVDASESRLQSLTDREPEIATLVSTGENLPERIDEEEGLADAVVCRAVLIHHAYKDVARLVKRFAEVTKPGGLLIADWPVSDHPEERTDWIGVTTWDRSIRLKTAEMAGWEPVDIDGDPSVWKRRVEVDEVIEAVKDSGGVRTEQIDNALPSNKVIREWANENGHTVSARGKIPTEVVTAYLEAHREDDIL